MAAAHRHQSARRQATTSVTHYRRLLAMTLLSFGSMYVLMYAMSTRLRTR